MNGRQQFVAVGGLGLVFVNYWTSDQRHQLSSGLFNSGGDVAGARATTKQLAGELLFIAVATLLAGVSSGWGTAMGAAIAALFLLWAINYYTKEPTK